MNDEMRREAMLSHEIELEIRSAGDDSDVQCEDIRYFLSQNIDLLIVAPNEAGEVTPAVEEAFDAGIPVIVVDRNIDGEKFTAFIGADNYHIGYMQSQYVKANLNSGQKIILLRGLTGSTPSIERYTGFLSGLDEECGIEILAAIDAKWSEQIAYTAADSLLTVYTDVDMIVCQNDAMARGAYKAAKDHHLDNDMMFIGVDGLSGEGQGIEYIIDGKLDASILYPTGGDVVIQTALKILQHKPFPRHILLETALVEKRDALLMANLSDEIQHQVNIIETLRNEVDVYWERYSIQTVFLYVCVISLVVFVLLAILLYKAKRTLENQRQRLIALNQELEETTRERLMFFTNVSHDFRTPLTLIAEPLRQLSESADLNEKDSKLIHIADKNVQVLKRLINQLLDFRKYEHGKAVLNLSPLDLKDCISKWMEAFSLTSVRKHIHLSFTVDEKYDYRNTVDAEKVERIFFNLMSNALKFTPQNGKIKVSLTNVFDDGNWHCFSVTNTGSTIPSEDIEHIFESYYQVNAGYSGGVGLGLVLVKTFVEMMNGRVEVTSSIKEGTSFSVYLPVVSVTGDIVPPVNLITSQIVKSELEEFSDCDESKSESERTLLVIDDNSDIRTLIRTVFNEEFTVVEASDGAQGISAAMRLIPDIVICDIMMPGIDGLECCRRLKSEVNTSHIPVILLTACALDEQRICGLNCGADAYIAKPFSSVVLVAQVKSLIENRLRIKEVFGDLSVADEKLSDPDKDFMLSLKNAIIERMDNSDLSVETLGEIFGMSRVQLYRKVKTLTNYSPVEIIRITRLKAARQLLLSTELTVAEVGYKVGFSSPSYFAKCYKEYFAELPNDTRSKKV